MKKIILKQLKLINFKGIKEKTIDFAEYTNIYGDNATGKTTLFDAFTWVMFGKDSSDKKDFNIKTLDEDGRAIPKIEHEVEALLNIDGEDVTLKSILREKWVTKRGQIEPEFTGHETVYFFNDTPMKQEEYRKKIGGIIDEKIFKIITSPSYFNSLKWQEMRTVLLGLVSVLTDKELAENCKGVEYLSEIFNTKTIDECRKEVLAKKKKIKSELEAIPARIDEVTKGMPESENWSGLENQISENTAEINAINEKICGANILSENDLRIKEEINKIKTEMLEFKSNVESEYINKRNFLATAVAIIKNEISETEQNIKNCERKCSNIRKELGESNWLIEKLRNKIKDLNNKVFDENTTVCPTCGGGLKQIKLKK